MRLSSNIAQLQPSATLAVGTLAKKLRSEGRDILDMSQGEPDFDTPDFISEAAIEGIRAGATRYTPAPGMPELRKAIAGEIAERTGKAVDWNGVVVTSGAKQALFNVCFALFGPGDEVLIASPYWTSYPEIVTLARATPVPVKGAEARDFRLTPADLEAARTPQTRGLIVCSPSNPTGSVYTAAELQAIAEWARDAGIWLISDEIYRQINFVDGGKPATGLLDLPAEAIGDYVIIDGASKSFAMTGWRIGFSVSRPEVAKEFSALQSHTTSNASTPSQMAALAAWSRHEEAAASVARMGEAFRRRRDLVVRLMKEQVPAFTFVQPDGAFYLFFRVDSAFSGEITGSATFCEYVLQKTGVALVPGIAFGDDRYARMSYACSDETITDAIQRMGSLFGPR